MAQFYARVFVQILDSSIAEDFMVRHVFEDMLKVCDMSGLLDMTRMAMSRRFNVPLDELNRCILKLESPDEHSRDEDFDGRRLERLDQHRDWGWRILNYSKYEAIRTRADVALRVQRHRQSKKPSNELARAAKGQGGATEKEVGPTENTPMAEQPPMVRNPRGSNRPRSVEEAIEAGKMLGLDEPSCRKFWLHYEGTARHDEGGNAVWVTGKTGEKRVGNWQALLGTWKAGDDERKAGATGSTTSRKEAHREAAPPGQPPIKLNVQTFTNQASNPPS